MFRFLLIFILLMIGFPGNIHAEPTAGDVFRDWKNYDINEMKYGGGAGIRYAISSKEKINLRFDLGISRYGVFPYVMFQEAF